MEITVLICEGGTLRTTLLTTGHYWCAGVEGVVPRPDRGSGGEVVVVVVVVVPRSDRGSGGSGSGGCDFGVGGAGRRQAERRWQQQLHDRRARDKQS